MKQQQFILRTRRKREKGHAVLEVAFLAPWLIFLFVGAFDMGFYCLCLDLHGKRRPHRNNIYFYFQQHRTDSSTACSMALGRTWLVA